MNKEYFNGVGRRKNSTARVYLSDGKGKFAINNVSDDINSYLKRESLVIHAVKPLEVLNLKGKYDIKMTYNDNHIIQEFEIIKDPRVENTLEDYNNQLSFL